MLFIYEAFILGGQAMEVFNFKLLPDDKEIESPQQDGSQEVQPQLEKLEEHFEKKEYTINLIIN